MNRVKLAWILPLVFIVLVEISLQAGRHPHQPVRGDIYWRSTFDLACAGLNAPADQMSVMIYALSSYQMGALLADLVYVTLVAVLWYLVGKKIDSWRSPEPGALQKRSAVRIIGSLLMVLYGLYMLLFLAFHNVLFTAPRNGNGGSSNFVGDLIHQSLWLLWSFILLIAPSLGLLKGFGSRAETPLVRG